MCEQEVLLASVMSCPHCALCVPGKALVGKDRVGLLLLRLCEMLRCNQIHLKAIINIQMNSSKYYNVQMPQLFQETFLNT